MKFNSREINSQLQGTPSRAEKEILIRKHLEEKKIANKDIEITEPILPEIKLEERSSAEFGIPRPEKVLGNEEVDLEKNAVPVVENVKEKAENLLRENFVKAQLDLEKARKAGGYDPEDFKAKKAPFEKNFEEAKKLYYESLKNNEGITNEEKGKFVVEEFNKLQDIKTDLRSEEEVKKAYFPINIIKEMGNWYKEQSSKQKYVVAGALIGTGALAAFMGLGGAVALPLGLAVTVSRALSGAGVMVGAGAVIKKGFTKFGMRFKGHEDVLREKGFEEIEKIKKGLIVESAADFFEKNEGELSDASERLYKESKKLETQRTLISGAMGAVIATGAFSEAIKNVMHWTGTDKAMKGAFDWAKERLGFGGHEGGVATSAGVEAQKLAELEKIKGLATIRKGEGVIHVFQRQLEDNPAKFGFTGDINNPAEVDKWVNQKAYDIAIKEGYIAEKGEVIVSGTQRVLEKDPLHYGFTGDVKNADEVHKWAMKEASDVASKTETNVPGVLETRVKWDYSKGPEDQATFTLSPEGKVTEAISSSAKHPEYLYDSTGVAKTQKGLDLINEQIKASDARINELNIEASKEARRRLATGMGSFHAEKELNEAIANADILAAQKNALEDKLKFYGGNASNHVFEAGYQASASHAELDAIKYNISETNRGIAEFNRTDLDSPSYENSQKLEQAIADKTALEARMSALENQPAGHSGSKVEMSPNFLGREHLKILKEGWLKEALDKTSGIKRSMAEDAINMKARDIYHDQELIKQLERSGQGNGQKVAFLKKSIHNAIASLEKQYGKIFK